MLQTTPPPPPFAYGGWYHFPSQTKCPDDGTPIGTDGCTWRRDPHAFMLYGQDLLAHGWNLTAVPTNEAIFGNTAAMAAAMSALTSRGCGEHL